jgi:formate-dependent nitrite reductase membrane component NrfD
MVAKIAAAAIGFLFLASLIFVGVACAAFAIDGALTNSVGAAGAAAITALIFLIVPLIALLVFALRRPRESTFVTLLTSFSRNSPLAAILGAAALGLAEVLLKKKRRERD